MARVLIVDDSRTSRKILRNILEEAGHEVIDEAVNGEDGFIKFKELKPDIVTLDITMPVLDGIETLRLMKETGIPSQIIMVTAAGQKGKMMEAIKLGASEFVTKPFEVNQIVELIKKY